MLDERRVLASLFPNHSKIRWQKLQSYVTFIGNQCRCSLLAIQKQLQSERQENPESSRQIHDHQAHKDWQYTKLDLWRRSLAERKVKVHQHKWNGRIKSQWSKVDVCFAGNRFLQFSIKSEEVESGFLYLFSLFISPKSPHSWSGRNLSINLIRTDKAILSSSPIQTISMAVESHHISLCQDLVWLRYFRFLPRRRR